MTIKKMLETFRGWLDGTSSDEDMRKAVAAVIEYIEKRIEQIKKI